MPAAAEQLARGIAVEFRRRLLGEYVPRIRRCVGMLTEAQCWQKPSAHGNSVANLLLHLAGNVRQWILVTFAGESDQRNRPLEFAADAAQAGVAAAELMDRLADTASRACLAVDRLGPAELLRQRPIQQQYQETGLAAVLHVIEHFAGHAGQIYAFTKQVTGRDLKFYDL